MRPLADRIGALAFLVLLGTLVAVGLPQLKDSMAGTGGAEIPFQGKMRAALVDSLAWKKHFIDLNGGFKRLLGQRICNGVVRLNNGNLGRAFMVWRSEEDRRTCVATNLISLARALKSRGCPFLYVQAPCNEDLGDSLRPWTDGIPSDNATAGRICGMLEASGAAVLDLRPVFSATPEEATRNFIRSDHHWTIDAAFAAFPLIVRAIADAMGLKPDRAESVMDASAWTRREMKSCSLGSHGRRTGRFFSGLDDAVWYEPRFTTEMSCEIPATRSLNRGSFREALVRENLVSERHAHKIRDRYNLYIGGNFPLVRHRNAQAPIKARILLVKDSFAIPIQAFLSTVFTDLEVLDLREYRDLKLMDYIGKSKPDAVVVLYFPGSLFNSKLFSF